MCIPSSVIACLLIIGASTLDAQMTDAPSTGLTITPKVGYTGYSALYDGPVAVAIPGFGLSSIPLKIEIDGQFEFGVDLRYGRPGTRWSVFGDVSRGSGDAQATACFEGDCATLKGDVTALHFSGGLGYRLPAFANSPSSLHLLLGANLTRVTLEDTDLNEDATLTNPGGLLGIALDYSLSPRLGLRLQVTDALVKVDTNELESTFSEDGASARLDSQIQNMVRLGVGLSLKF